MSQRLQNWLILLGVAALTLIADRLSKVLAASNLALNETWDLPVPLLTRVFRVTYTTNTGAAFGLFPNQGVLFIVIAFIVIVAIIYYYRHLPNGYGLLRVALGLQLGGALGNLIDRLRHGYVIDFIDFNFWPLQDWPVFNLADSAIVVGVVLLAATMLFEDVEKERVEAFSSSRDTAGEPDPPYPARNSSSSRDSL